MSEAYIGIQPIYYVWTFKNYLHRALAKIIICPYAKILNVTFHQKVDKAYNKIFICGLWKTFNRWSVAIFLI